MTCLQIYRELLSLATFLRVHSNSKEVSYLSWQNTYPNVRTTCHVNLKFFLWTNLLENLLLAKSLISVPAVLIYCTKCPQMSCRTFEELLSISNGKDKNSHLLKYAVNQSHSHAALHQMKIVDSGYLCDTFKRKMSEALYIKQFQPWLNTYKHSLQVKHLHVLVFLRILPYYLLNSYIK